MKVQKKVTEWFKELPEPYSELATSNFNNDNIRFSGVNKEVPVSSLLKALSTFNALNTKEGDYFWRRVKLACFKASVLNPKLLPPLSSANDFNKNV